MILKNLFKSSKDFLNNIPLKEGMTVVDYAFGLGRYTIQIAELVGSRGKVYAVDNRLSAIKIVKKKAAQRLLTNVQTMLIGSFNTGIPNSSADIVLISDELIANKNHEALFYEIYRLLKPDGFLFMGFHHLEISKARSLVEGTGLFNMVNFEGKNMLLTRR